MPDTREGQSDQTQGEKALRMSSGFEPGLKEKMENDSDPWVILVSEIEFEFFGGHLANRHFSYTYRPGTEKMEIHILF